MLKHEGNRIGDAWFYVHDDATTTTSVTLRRLQQFVPASGIIYRYQLSQNNKVLQRGQLTADRHGLLTVFQIAVTQEKATLTIMPEQQWEERE